MSWVPRSVQSLMHSAQCRTTEREVNIIGLPSNIGKSITEPKVYLLLVNVVDESAVPRRVRASLANINLVANHNRWSFSQYSGDSEPGEGDETTSEIIVRKLTRGTGPW